MTATKLIKTVREKLTRATASVTTEIDVLRNRIEHVRAQLRKLRNSPVPREEIAARIRLAVDQAAAGWRSQTPSVISGHRGKQGLGDPSYRDGQLFRLPWSASEHVPWGALCAAEPERAEAFLAALVDATDFEPGPPSAERAALVEQLEAELAELEAEEEEAIDAAAAAGVEIAHRPEVIQRRQDEARELEREARAIEDREAREKALEEHYARRRSTGPSQYLADADARIRTKYEF